MGDRPYPGAGDGSDPGDALLRAAYGERLHRGVGALLTGGLLAIAVIVAWEVRAIMKADYPGVQGIEALAVTVPLFLLLYSTASTSS